jgi:hypothetical protein
MTLTIDIPKDRLKKLTHRIKNYGLAPEEFAQSLLEYFSEDSNIDLDSWIETLEVLNDKDMMRAIKKSKEDFSNGRVYSIEDI